MNRAGLIGTIALFVGMVGAAHAAMAQSEPARIVQGSDGTLFLLRNGARYAIAVDVIDDEALQAYADAGTIGSDQLLSALSTTSAPATNARRQEATGAPQGQATDVVAPTADEAPAADAAAQVAPTTPQQPQQTPCPATPPGAKRSAACPSGRPAAVDASPHFTAVRTVAAGGTAQVGLQSAPGVTCSLQYRMPPGSGSFTAVGDQTADANGVMTWSFAVGNLTGVGTLVATCGDMSTTSSLQIGTPGAVR